MMTYDLTIGKETQSSFAVKSCLNHASPRAPTTCVERSWLGRCVPVDVSVTCACQVRYRCQRYGYWGIRKWGSAPAAWSSLSRPTGGKGRNGDREGIWTKWVVQARGVYKSRQIHVLCTDSRGRWRVCVTTLGHHQSLTHTSRTWRRYTTRTFLLPRVSSHRHSQIGFIFGSRFIDL